MLDDIDMMLLFLLYRRETKKNSFQVHSRYRKKFLKNLGSLQRRLRQRRIPRVSLQDASQSAWKTLFNSGNDQALITLTGLTFEVFNWLLPKLSDQPRRTTKDDESNRLPWYVSCMDQDKGLKYGAADYYLWDDCNVRQPLPSVRSTNFS
ncbi:hypothetical protein MHU86_1385 [Fragilaria crotonensis]|nr:hypothetical protein MHU86_20196 [Fragilaria crotonensis]KAI2507949.1 hypothetical protein MHU86_6482 [Fragilaria crotonensis]KAI2513093.1 hypothetical protein MHU86_1385 [Fragilaria crotonensis]